MHLPFLGEFDPVSAWLLRAAAASRPNAILHAHSSHTASLAYLASQGSGLPWVAHRRVDFPVSNALSRRVKYDSADAVICVSQAIADILAGQGVPKPILAVVPDCIPLPHEAREAGAEELRPVSASDHKRHRERIAKDWGLPLDEPWIGKLAALVPHKDHANLVRAFARVRSKLGKGRLIIAGEGPLEGPLKALIKELGLEGSAHLVGQRSDRAAWLGSFDVYVQSSWGEGMGSVLLEAMACGRPIAATNAGGIKEIVSDGETGLLAAPRDAEGLAANIIRLIEEPRLADRLTKAGLERLRRFSLAENASRVQAIYAGVSRLSP